MELTLILRLVFAHLLGDFLLQPTKWVKAKNNKKEKAPEMYYHIMVVTLLTYIFLWDWSHWYLPLMIMVSHLAIDIWKSHHPHTFNYFIVDQMLHLLVIVSVWVIFYFDTDTVFTWTVKYFNSVHFWILIIGYYVVTVPLGIAIGSATGRWQEDAAMNTGGLDKAGMWIGRCERVLILTFILTNQYTALGFLMAAKSILRFGDAEERAQKKTEYILVGTLMSFAAAAIIGTAVNYLLHKY